MREIRKPFALAAALAAVTTVAVAPADVRADGRRDVGAAITYVYHSGGGFADGPYHHVHRPAPRHYRHHDRYERRYYDRRYYDRRDYYCPDVRSYRPRYPRYYYEPRYGGSRDDLDIILHYRYRF